MNRNFTETDWKQISYFTPDEPGMACPCCGLCHPSHNLIVKLDMARELFGKPISLTSCCRCPDHNREVGGVSGSEHCIELLPSSLIISEGADLICNNSRDRYDLIYICSKLFPRIGVGKNFIHVGCSETHPQQVMWMY